MCAEVRPPLLLARLRDSFALQQAILERIPQGGSTSFLPKITDAVIPHAMLPFLQLGDLFPHV